MTLSCNVRPVAIGQLHTKSQFFSGGKGPNIGTECKSHQGKVNLQILKFQHDFMHSELRSFKISLFP